MTRVPRALVRVISGGQTGVDRAALDAARSAGLALGGWCPPGRAATSGPIPAEYPLRETPEERSPAAPDVPRSLRTEWNVRDADAVLVLRPLAAPIDPGTEWTVRCAGRLGRALLVLDPGDAGAPARVRNWLTALGVRTLAVAGPSEELQPGIGACVRRLLEEAFT
ncbi:MAG TPA: putative molybdenum carrier protein [Anaeromyxobacter sp.]|nr:putative molybdenum carrier protein [Anaeromyxobacter sp.]